MKKIIVASSITIILILAVSSSAKIALEGAASPEILAKLSGPLQMQLEIKQRALVQPLDGYFKSGFLPLGGGEFALTHQLIFVHTHEYPSADEIAAIENLGGEVFLSDWITPLSNHPTGFFLVRAPADKVHDIAGLPFVVRLGSGEEAARPLNDQAAFYTGASQVWNLGGGTTGEGVRVGVLDSGLDLTHPDIPTPVFAVDYSAWPDSDFTIANTVIGHGTHVAGTVLGRGTLSQEMWKGMAPEAELVFIKIGDDAQALETTACVVHSYIAVADYYDCDISSMSYGLWNEFLDGSAETEQAVDYAFEQGVLVFCAGGNSAYSSKHYSGYVSARDSTDYIEINIASWAGGDLFLVNLIAYDDPDTLIRTMMDMHLFDATYQPIPYTLTTQTQSFRGTENLIITEDDMLPSGGTNYFLKVYNISHHDQFFHLYIEVQTQEGSYPSYYHFDEPDSYFTMGSPAIADNAIAVAAYSSRNQWMNYLGNTQSTSYTLGDLASFSSWGPRVDGAFKPDIASPGSMLISCRDEIISLNSSCITNYPNTIGTPADYVVMHGTSMACPSASGSAALVLSYAPHYSNFDLRELLINTAAIDTFTGSVPNPYWGYGKIDVLNAFNNVSVGQPRESGLPAEFALLKAFPNPFNSTAVIEYKLPRGDNVSLKVIDVMGREVTTLYSGFRPAGSYQVKWNGKSATGNQVASGIYFIRLKGEKSEAVGKVLLIR